MKGTTPCFFAGKKKKEEYRSRLNEITAQLVKLSDEEIEYSKREKEINNNILSCQTKLELSTKKQEDLQRPICQLEESKVKSNIRSGKKSP